MKDCKGCGKRATASSTYNRRPAQTFSRVSQPRAVDIASDDDFVMIRYNTPNKSQHHLHGTVQFEYRMKLPGNMFIEMQPHPQGGWRFYYGYKCGGDVFMVHRNDAERERYFESVEPVRSVRDIQIPRDQQPREMPPPPPAPKRMTVQDVVGEMVESAGETIKELVYPADMPAPPPPQQPEPVSAEGKPGLTGEQGVLQSKLDSIPPSSYDILNRMLREEVHGDSRPWAIAMIRDKMDAQLDGEPEMPYSRKNIMDFQQLPGIGKAIADALKRDGYETIDDILSLGVDGLMSYKGIGRGKALRIIEATERLQQE